MSEIEAIKKYLEWAEERRISGEPHSVEAYEEAMRVLGYERGLQEIIDFTKDDYKTDPQGGLGRVHVIARAALEQSA